MDTQDKKPNGEAALIPVADVLTIMITRRPWHVNLKMPNIEETQLWIAALRQCADSLEVRVRVETAAALQREMAENAALAEVGRKVARQ